MDLCVHVWYDCGVSTTIANAWKLVPGATVFGFASEVRSVMLDTFYDSLAYSLMMDTVRAFEMQKNYEKGFTDMLQDSWRSFLSNSQEGGIDASFVVFSDMDDIVDGVPQLYVKFLLSGEGTLLVDGFDISELMLSLSSVEREYHYWNGTDSQLSGDNAITEEEWCERADVWRKLIPTNMNINLLGVTVHVFDRMELAVKFSGSSLVERVSGMTLPSDDYRVLRRRGYLYLDLLRDEVGELKFNELIMENIGMLNRDYESVASDEYAGLYAAALVQAEDDVAFHPYDL